MSNKRYEYELISFIGRFEPPHIGHHEVINHALSLADTVLILIGSAGKPRSIKNPWTYAERAQMLRQSFSHISDDRLIIQPLYDQTYNDQQWVANVQSIVGQLSTNRKIGIIGHSKDSSSYYLKMFPQWDLIEHALNENVDATDIRGLLFQRKSLRFIENLVTPSTYTAIANFCTSPEYEMLVNEYDHIRKYTNSWKGTPYPVTFVTTDAVVIQSGHVLLVERDAAPGEGLLALPGGFLNPRELIVDGALRELREETKLKVPIPVLRGSIKQREVFDDPSRSERGRTITHAVLIELPPGPLPAVKGSDDARKAFWCKLADLREDNMFEDHYHIIKYFLGQL